MIQIRVRGAANAQALFDSLHGRGVTWRDPYRPQDAHTITVQRLTVGEANNVLSSLRIERATVKGF